MLKQYHNDQECSYNWPRQCNCLCNFTIFISCWFFTFEMKQIVMISKFPFLTACLLNMQTHALQEMSLAFKTVSQICCKKSTMMLYDEISFFSDRFQPHYVTSIC